MADVKRVDLSDIVRTLELFRDAVARGLTDGTEHRRLMFVALAERALRVGESNPCGLFRKLVFEGRWAYATDRDEDAAHDRLKRYLFGDVRKREREAFTPRAKPVRIELSEDARLVQAVQIVASRYRVADPFYLLKRERPEWTRERWGRSVSQLENARLARMNYRIAQTA